MCHIAQFLVHLLLQSELIKNWWNSLEINKIWMKHSVKLMLFPRSWWLRMRNYGRQHPPSLNWGSVDQELHQCLPPCRYLVHNILLFPYVLMKSWLIPKVLGDGAYSFSFLGLERLLDWTTFTGVFPATCSGSQLGFLQEFSKEVQVSQWYSLVAHSVWSSPMVEMSDHVLPISTADMRSLWVGRCMHTMVTCIARPKGNPSRGRYLAKFRSHGTWGIWRVWSGWSGWLPILIYLNSIICNMEWRVGFFFPFLFFFLKER